MRGDPDKQFSESSIYKSNVTECKTYAISTYLSQTRNLKCTPSLKPVSRNVSYHLRRYAYAEAWHAWRGKCQPIPPLGNYLIPSAFVERSLAAVTL